jgi:hypothetical protein
MMIMRVVCINDQWSPSPSAIDNPRPRIGDIYTVTDEVYVPKFGGVFYEFEDYPDCFYYKAMFVELPDPSADELIEETTIAETLTA